MFATGEDENLELLTRGPPPKHHAPVYGQTPFISANASTSGGACSSMNPYTGHTIASSRQHKESRSGHPSSSHRLEHRAPLHWQRPLIKTQLTTTSSSGEVPVGTPPIRVASSSWWPRPEHICRTAPVGIESTSSPPSGFWCLNDKTIKELMTFAKCETVKISYELY
jgi:hypothetical protein